MKVFHKKFVVWSFLVLSFMVLSGPISIAAQHHESGQHHSDSDQVTAGELYYLSTCPVSGQKLGSMGKPVVYNHEGREVRFCCSGCISQFDKDPQKFLDQIDQTMIKDQLSHYPMETCLISGQKLTAMGKPVNRIYQNRLVRFCCNNCVPQFEKNPEEHMKKLNKAIIEQQKDEYPMYMCVVSGQKLGGSMGEPVDVVLANRLVRLCCPSCEKLLQENPNDYLSKLESKQTQDQPMQHQQGDHSGHQH